MSRAIICDKCAKIGRLDSLPKHWVKVKMRKVDYEFRITQYRNCWTKHENTLLGIYFNCPDCSGNLFSECDSNEKKNLLNKSKMSINP